MEAGAGPVSEMALCWLPRILGACAFALYALVAPGGTYWLDSGELAAAGVDLGSPHPTGFPLYMLLVKLATFVPLGELAFRVNLLSASCAAVAVGCAARLIIELCRSETVALVGAVAGGATLALSLAFFRQATVAEVYAPTAAFLAATLLLFDRVVVGGRPGAGLALAILAGLGVGLHTSYGLALPVLAVLLVVRLRRGARWPLLVPLLVALVGGALYTYLPVRSATGRVVQVDWDHPRTVDGFLDHVTARRIRAAYEDEMRATERPRVAHNLSTVARDVADHLGPFALLAGLAGLGWLFRHRRTRWAAAALAVIAVGDFVYAFWINPMGQVDLQNTVPLALAVAIAAGAGVAWFGRILGPVGPYVAAVTAVVLAVTAAAGALSQVSAARTGDLPRRWAEEAFERVPAGGVALVENDSTAATMIFLAVAEGARPDVAVLVKQHLGLDAERTEAVLRLSGPAPAPVDPADPMAAILATGRPIGWELGRVPPPRGRVVLADVPLARLGAKEAQGGRADDLRVALVALTEIFAAPGARDANARRTHAVGLTQLGRLAYERRQLDVAGILFEAALAVRPRHVAALVNQGAVAAAQGDFARAAALTERALAVDPTHALAYVNAARYRQRLGDVAAARAHLEQALALAPNRADAWALAAVLHFNAGEVDAGRRALERAMEIDPTNRDARDLLRQLRAAE